MIIELADDLAIRADMITAVGKEYNVSEDGKLGAFKVYVQGAEDAFVIMRSKQKVDRAQFMKMWKGRIEPDVVSVNFEQQSIDGSQKVMESLKVAGDGLVHKLYESCLEVITLLHNKEILSLEQKRKYVADINHFHMKGDLDGFGSVLDTLTRIAEEKAVLIPMVPGGAQDATSTTTETDKPNEKD